MTVLPLNDQPVAAAQLVSALTNSPQSIRLTASDVDHDPLNYTILTEPARGTLSGTPPNLTYTPTPGATGTDNFTFKVNDGKLDSGPATVSILISERPIILLGKPSVLLSSPVEPAQMSFDIVAPDGINYIIEASPDFIKWTPVEMPKDIRGAFSFHEVGGAEHRFYRARLAPCM